MIREMTCILCPKGCRLKIEGKDGKVISLTGNQCPKGESYGRQETENPERIVTLTVAAEGLELRRIPVRTSQPVPKDIMTEIVKAAQKIRIIRPVVCGEVLVRDICATGTDLVATRPAGPRPQKK